MPCLDHKQICRDLLSWQLMQHPLPWRIEDDWTREVTAADGTILAKCMSFAEAEAIIAAAEALHAEWVAGDRELEAMLND